MKNTKKRIYAANHGENPIHTVADITKNNIKLVNREDLEGSKTSPNSCMLLKTTKKAILTYKTKENQPREMNFLVYGNNNIIIDEQIVEGLKDYLVKQKQSSHTIRNKIHYVKRFSYILQKENAPDLMLQILVFLV